MTEGSRICIQEGVERIRKEGVMQSKQDVLGGSGRRGDMKLDGCWHFLNIEGME